MIYIIDSADTVFISMMIEKYNVQGVTTNPTIICKEKKKYYPLLKEIEGALDGRDFHIQLVSTSYEEMISEALTISKIVSENIHIKIPVSDDGYKAIKHLSGLGFKITATAVCTVNQGIMAALQGAKSIAVYVNRISNSGLDGNAVIKDIKDAYVRFELETKIIGASYKSVHQVTDSIRCGVDQVTVGKELFEKLFYSDITDKSIEQFSKDFSEMYNSKEGF